ncbi:MAG: PAS domain S-box protein [Armatimonadetes bacterium]|nr:PAS domain S-box protein [Armatimonadota bacterium]
MRFVMAAAVNVEDLVGILGQVPLAVCALEIPSLRILAANQALASLAAAGNPAEIVGVTLSEEVQRGVLSDLLPPLREAAAAGGNLPPREVHAQLGGESRDLLVQCHPLGLHAGAMVAILTEVTTQRQMERALCEREHQYRALFEENPYPMYIYDQETLAFLAANDAMLRQSGYSRDELLSMTVKEIWPPEDAPAFLESERQNQPGKVMAGVWRHRRKDGSTLYVDLFAHSIIYQGRAARVVLAHDVTERIEAEERLKLTTSELSAIFQALPDLYFRLKADGTILDYRAGHEASLYLPPSEFKGRRVQDVLPPPAACHILKGIERTSREHALTTVEYPLPNETGTRIFEARLVPVLDGQVVAIARDITESREAEERLRTSEINYRSIFDAVNDAILVHDPATGRILDVNRKMREMYGYTTEETRALTIGDLSANEEPYTLSRALEWVHRAAQGEPQLFEWLAKDRSGRRFWVEVNLKRATIGGEERLLAVVRDITERKRAIQEVEAAHQRMRRGEDERKRFYREMIRAVTHDKLHLVDAHEIPTVGQLVLSVPLDQPDHYARLRDELRQIAQKAGMTPETTSDLLMAAGEAATNAIKHATCSESTIYLAPDRIIVRVSDRGSGIQPEDLPGALLLPGFSTRVSLGMGYTIMLRLADRVWLATSAEGTVVQLEKWIHPEDHQEPALTSALEKM